MAITHLCIESALCASPAEAAFLVSRAGPA